MATPQTRVEPAVVIVDDDLGILAALRRALRNEPYEVLSTTDPLEALCWISARDVRAIMVDERMPQMSGSQLLSWVRPRFPQIPCVVLTGYEDTALVIAEKDLRIERLVMKPWDDENLRRLLRGLAGSRPGPPEPAGCRVECEGRTDVEALSQILPELLLAGERGRTLVIEVDHLAKLDGPLGRFLLSLVRLAAEQRVRVVLRDASGLAATALQAIRRAEPFVSAGGRE